MIDVAILGGGAAGLFCARWLGGLRYRIFEHNAKPARKIVISGGGRCNVTNKQLTIDRYLTHHPNIAWEILQDFDNYAMLSWLRANGCEPVVRKETQLFCPRSAQELVNILHTDNIIRAKITALEFDGKAFVVHTTDTTYRAKVVLVATGGLSYRRTGASGIGFEIARSFGHTVAPLAPALTGLTLQPQQWWCKELSGISLQVRVQVEHKLIEGDMLFTHRGLSGPAILNASLYWRRGAIEIAFLQRFPKLAPHRQLSSQLPLPKRFTKALLAHLGLKDQKVSQYDEKQLRRVRQALCAYRFAPAGMFGYEHAEVTRGGVMLDELDERLQSRIVPGLFFAGEVCDVTGELGGYNFQWAWSSAVRAAKGLYASVARS